LIWENYRTADTYFLGILLRAHELVSQWYHEVFGGLGIEYYLRQVKELR